MMVDRLQLSVKQLEGQMGSLQAQLDMTTKTRDDLAQEVFKLSNENEDLKKLSAKVASLQSEKSQVEQKYAVLQIQIS